MPAWGVRLTGSKEIAGKCDMTAKLPRIGHVFDVWALAKRYARAVHGCFSDYCSSLHVPYNRISCSLVSRASKRFAHRVCPLSLAETCKKYAASVRGTNFSDLTTLEAQM